MKHAFLTLVVMVSSFFVFTCSEGESGNIDENPFLESAVPPGGGKSDTGWISSLDAPEVQLTFESDISVTSLFDAKAVPADLSQFALTNLAKSKMVYVESMLAPSEAERKVEWLIDGEWVDADRIDEFQPEQLIHFRITGLNAIIYKPENADQLVGRTYTAEVPKKPYFLFNRVGDRCSRTSSSALGNYSYWYYWDPDKRTCDAEILLCTVTVTEVLNSQEKRYPEYDELLKDGKVTAIVFFGKISSGELKYDEGQTGMRTFSRYLREAGFQEETSPSGLVRYAKTVNDIEHIVDISGPGDFEGLGDYTNVEVFDGNVRTHELVVYNGHSILGTSDFWSRDGIYPEFYQIFFFNGCLGYEYYVGSILKGKKSWDVVDVLSNVRPTPVSPQPAVIATFLARVLEGASTDGTVSWLQIVEAVINRGYNSYYGVSGARNNCFAPGGSFCDEFDEDVIATFTFDGPTSIPDDNSEGVETTIEVDSEIDIQQLSVDLEILHPFIGDISIALEYNGVSEILWEHTGGNSDNIHQTFETTSFAGMNSKGTWTLRVSDNHPLDTGKLMYWTLIFSKASP